MAGKTIRPLTREAIETEGNSENSKGKQETIRNTKQKKKEERRKKKEGRR